MFLHCLCFIWPFCECCVFHHNNIIVENVRDFADSASVKTWKAEKDFQNLPSESALPSSTSIYHHISNWSQPKHPPCSEEYWNNCQCHNSLLLFLLMFFCRCYPSHLCFCYHFVSCSFFSREFQKQISKNTPYIIYEALIQKHHFFAFLFSNVKFCANLMCVWGFTEIWSVSSKRVIPGWSVQPPTSGDQSIYRTFDIFIVFCINHDFRIVLLLVKNLHHNWNSCALFQLSRTAVDSAGYFVLKPGMIAFELHCVLWRFFWHKPNGKI